MKSAKVSTGKLRCTVGKGMFSDEATIIVKDFGGLEYTFFVPKTKVVEDTVLVVQEERADRDSVCVTIPTAEPSTVIFVRKEDLS